MSYLAPRLAAALVFKSQGKYLATKPTWLRPAGVWTADINAALLFEGTRTDYGAEGVVIDFEDFMEATPAERLLHYFTKRYPPRMVPTMVLLKGREEERAVDRLYGTLSG